MDFTQIIEISKQVIPPLLGIILGVALVIIWNLATGNEKKQKALITAAKLENELSHMRPIPSDAIELTNQLMKKIEEL